MNKIKFLHCADIHLEAPFTSLGSERQLGNLRRQELKESFKRMIKAAGDFKADFLFISGDLYEQGYATKSTLHFINGLFETIPSTEIIILPGNHDPYTANSFYASYQWANNVHILKPSDSHVLFEQMGVCVYSANSFQNGAKTQAVLNASHNGTITEPAQGVSLEDTINIMLLHGTIDMNIGQGTFNPFTSDQLAKCGMDYIAAGHFHNHLEDVGQKDVIYNPGSLEPLGFDEEGEHGYFLGSIEKGLSGKSVCRLEFIKNSLRQYRNIEVSIDGCTTDEDTAVAIEAAVRLFDVNKDLFSITLKGYINKDYFLNKHQIYSILKDQFFFLRLKDDTMVDYDLDILIREPGIKGQFARKVLHQIGQTSDMHEKNRLMKALYLGLEALDGRMQTQG